MCMNMLGSCVQHCRNTLWKYDCCKKYSPTPKSARTKDPNNLSETGPWLGSWGRDGLGRGGCCAASLAQAGI